MILVHSKNPTVDPYGAQRVIMAYLAKQRNGQAGQPEIEAHVLAECQCHAIGQLEGLRNQGAIEPLDGSPSVLRLTAEGREWCREAGFLRKRANVMEDATDEPNEPEEQPAAPKKRGRPRRDTPAAE